MATSTLRTDNTETNSIIAGYFQSGEDAHRAINELLDEGFSVSQIGAAFHTATGATAAPDSYVPSTMRQELSTTASEHVDNTQTSLGGPGSGTTAVQPVGLATGSGSPILGAGKPGPISGSSLEHTGLPSELKSEFAHDAPGSAPAAPSTVSHTYIAPQHTASSAPASWTEKLKHLFTKKEITTAPMANNESQNFGTGEGELGLEVQHGHPYSRAAFESSVTSAGVPVDHSRHLSGRLSSGGAVVTVSDTGRTVEVEEILERHNGVVRFQSDIFNDAPSLSYEPRVEVFGHLEHRYPSR